MTPTARVHAEDRTLVEAVLTGCSDAEDRFVKRMVCIPRTVELLNRTTQLTRQTLDDVSQEVFRRVWARLAEYRGESRLETWVFSFVRITLREFVRQEVRARVGPTGATRPLEEAVDESTCSSAAPTLTDDEQRALDGYHRLPSALRLLLHARILERESFAELAARFGLTTSVVKQRYYRALAGLRQSEWDGATP